MRLLAMAVLTLLMSGWIPGTFGRDNSISATDRAVLQVVIALQCQGIGRGNVLLSSKPLPPSSTGAESLNPFGDLSSTTIQQLIDRSRNTESLPDGIVCGHVRVENYQRIRDALGKPARHAMDFPVPSGSPIPIAEKTAFKDTYPDVSVLLQVSMPGYSASKDVAIVYIYENCGGSCEFDEYVVLRRIEHDWRVITRKKSWAWAPIN